MKLRFGTARNGWLPAELEANAGRFAFDISYLPNDFLLELIEALTGLLRGAGEWRACLPQEPVEVEWRFFRIQDGCVFSLVEFPGSERTKGSGAKIFEFSGYPLEIVLPIWRGIRELRGRKFKEGFGTHWRHHWAHPFPDQALDALTAAIEDAGEESRGEKPLPEKPPSGSTGMMEVMNLLDPKRRRTPDSGHASTNEPMQSRDPCTDEAESEIGDRKARGEANGWPQEDRRTRHWRTVARSRFCGSTCWKEDGGYRRLTCCGKTVR